MRCSTYIGFACPRRPRPSTSQRWCPQCSARSPTAAAPTPPPPTPRHPHQALFFLPLLSSPHHPWAVAVFSCSPARRARGCGCSARRAALPHTPLPPRPSSLLPPSACPTPPTLSQGFSFCKSSPVRREPGCARSVRPSTRGAPAASTHSTAACCSHRPAGGCQSPPGSRRPPWSAARSAAL